MIITRKPRLIIKRAQPKFWSVHTHSAFSAEDALPSVREIVQQVAALGQPGLGLTDHGNMAGSVELYLECMKAGIKPFPGSELYLVKNIGQHKANWKKKPEDKDPGAKRFHMGVVAYNTKGYENLVNLSTTSHKNFYHKPLVDLELFAQLHEDGKTEGLAITTGCYFGLIAQTLIHEGEAQVKQYLRALDTWFPGSVYVEVQNHNIEHEEEGWNDDKVADGLLSIASELGLPAVITQDSHYTKVTDRSDHEALKRLVAFGPDPDDAVFPGDGFHLADDEWIAAHHHPTRLAAGLEGLKHLLDRHDLHIPVLDEYKYRVPTTVTDPDTALERRVRDALAERNRSGPQVLQRLDAELDVIRAGGMAGYLLLTAEITDYMRAEKILFQTRGSAAGSLVCWALGITGPDPIKWDLRFERFLSKDRTKPPDIDLDIEHARRTDVLQWMSTKWSVHQIGTWAKASLTSEEGEDSKGSLLVKYYSAKNKQLGADETALHGWSEVPAEDREWLRRLSERGTYKGVGKNAAGILITATKAEVDKMIPMMWIASSKSMLTQYNKDHVELMGFVKLDVMGIKTLTVIREALKLLGKEDLEWIPAGHGPTYSAIRSGQTDGVFQLSGWSAQRGCQELRPSGISDVIAAMALFRPATQSSGATRSYVARKHGKEAVPSRHEIITKATSSTYGIMLYQEQVIQVLRDLGMNADDLTKFLKAVKASNKDIGDAGKVITGYQTMVASLCESAQMTKEDQAWLSTAIDGFSQYGFNSAHATTYGLTAYQTAYLMVTSPLEFHTALLAVAAGDPAKEPGYLRAAKKRGVKIYNPDINVSGYSYTFDPRRKAVRKGLLAIKGIGKVVAAELVKNQPYVSLNDLLDRVNGSKVSGVNDLRKLRAQGRVDLARIELVGSMKALYEVGALNSVME